MRRALQAGLAYFLVVFVAGFLLGTVRTLLVLPHVGVLTAVALELPVILAVSWIACGWALRRFDVPDRRAPRVVMGATAFALLMAGEVSISMLLAGRTLADHVDLYRTLPALLGLAGQIVYAVLPLFRRRTRS